MKTLTVNEKFSDLKKTLNLVKVSADGNPPKRGKVNKSLLNESADGNSRKNAELIQPEEITNPPDELLL
jgi:hypothetical protein